MKTSNKSLHADRYPRRKTARAPAGELRRYIKKNEKTFYNFYFNNILSLRTMQLFICI